MGKADRNAPDAPVPDFAYTDRHDGRVFVRLLDGDGKYRKKTIGYLTDSAAGAERMIPNRYFRDKYRDLYEESCPDVIVPPRELSMGMYALTLGITAKNGLYDDLVNVYGPVFANVILDYAMFLVWHRQGEAVSFAKNMAGEVLFEDRLRSESWYADFFARKLNEDSHHEFRIKLAQRLKSQGLKKVWLAMTDGGVSEFCHENKTPSGTTAVCREKGGKSCCIYALDASSGQPVTYFVCEDGVPGSQAFQKAAAMMSAFLGSLDAEIEGIILGSGFAKEQVFEIIAEHNWKYVSMLPSNALGHLEMIREYGDAIRWKSAYLICDDAVQGETLFGISGNEKLFAEHERRSAVCLYYDGACGSFRSAKLLKRIQAAARKAREAISRNTAVIIPPNLEKYIASKLGNQKPVVLGIYDYRFFLDHAVIEAQGLELQKVKDVVREYLRKYPNISFVVDYEKAASAPIPAVLRDRILLGYNFHRSGDIIVVVEPGYYEVGPWSSPVGTTHGGWNPYDAHIPLLFYGWRIPHGASPIEVHITDIAPTICSLLHIQQPNACIGNALEFK